MLTFALALAARVRLATVGVGMADPADGLPIALTPEVSALGPVPPVPMSKGRPSGVAASTV